MTSDDHKQLILPHEPGVYFFRDAEGAVLYIGRATDLRDRTKSYFARDLSVTRGPHMVLMVNKAATITWQTTPTVMDAILLESRLIHTYKPYYNTKEKDDKSGTYIIITKDTIPVILTERWRTYVMNKELYKGATLFGPYPSAQIAKNILRFIRKAFPFVDGKKNHKQYHAFYSQLGLLPNTAQGDSSAIREYKKRITYIKKVLNGDRTLVIRDLEKTMNQYAQKQEFEIAADYRDCIKHLSKVSDMNFIKDTAITSNVDSLRIEAYDTSHFGGSHHVGVMTVLEYGEPVKSEYRSFTIKSAGAGDDISATTEVLYRRLHHPEWTLPQYIVIDGGDVHKAHAEHVLQSLAHTNPQLTDIRIVSVVKDDKHKAREVLSTEPLSDKIQKLCILANSEAHRFSMTVMHAVARKSRVGKSTPRTKSKLAKK
jgi:excinuclease ABC subunit C